MQGRYHFITIFIMFLFTFNLQASNGIKLTTMEEDEHHINTWNEFADRVLQLHRVQIANKKVRKKERIGGYMGQEEFYLEQVFTEKKWKGKVISTVQWELENRDQMHMVAVNIYDKKGRLIRDYLAAYLPEHRNAPIQTLINLHYHGKGLHAYRQFDASGNKIYEFCRGKIGKEEVHLSLWEDEFYKANNPVFDTVSYQMCFDNLPKTSSQFSNPLVDAPKRKS